MKKLNIKKLTEQLLNEVEFFNYKGLVRVSYNPDLTMSEVADMVRSLPGVTIVTNVSHDEEKGIAVYSVKLLSTKKGSQAYDELKQSAITKLPEVRKLEVGVKTIEVIN